MVAYSYQREFIDPTLSGRKTHTIRREGKRRHARPGEALQHYTAMRTKQCRLFARSTCLKVLPIRINFSAMYPGDTVTIDDGPRIWQGDLEPFAQADGFNDWNAMRAFWDRHHPNVPLFFGLIIYWHEMQPAQ